MIAYVSRLGLLLALQVPAPDLGERPAAELRREWVTIHGQEATRLQGLAARLEGSGEADAARSVRAVISEKPGGGGPTRFVLLPKVEGAQRKGLADVKTKPDKLEARNDGLRAVRESTASALFKLAERALSTPPKHYALAEACLRGVIQRQPDHAEARRLLGYVPFNGGWATPYARKRLEDGMVDHPTFGWVNSSWVPHLDNGELPAPAATTASAPKGEPLWLPAAEADRLRSPWNSPWRISTEHFEIRTNVPLSEAIAFGRQLEGFHDLFFALMADLIETDNRLPLAQRFRDKKMVGERNVPPHQIYYFKEKQEYVDHLIAVEPFIEGSLGIYIPPKKGKKRAPAYFYRDPGGKIEATATLFHEVSHQLLFESAGPNAYDRNVGNYWVFEGLGTYFETVVPKSDGVLEVGGLVGPRIEAAQAWRKAGEFLPIERLLQLDERPFKAEEAIYLHYAESMALAVFLMQAQDGLYRDAFLDYAKDAYRGRLRRNTGRSLESRLGVSYPELDREFRDFLKQG